MRINETTPMGIFNNDFVFSLSLSISLSLSVPAQSIPFQVQFKTDADEAVGKDAAAAPGVANENEQDSSPGGILGFSLNFMQIACA